MPLPAKTQLAELAICPKGRGGDPALRALRERLGRVLFPLCACVTRVQVQMSMESGGQPRRHAPGAVHFG